MPTAAAYPHRVTPRPRGRQRYFRLPEDLSPEAQRRRRWARAHRERLLTASRNRSIHQCHLDGWSYRDNAREHGMKGPGGVQHVLRSYQPVIAKAKVVHLRYGRSQRPVPAPTRRQVYSQPLAEYEGRRSIDSQSDGIPESSSDFSRRREPGATERRPITPEQVREMLACIPSDDRSVWLRVGFSVKAAIGEAGRGLWIAWSATSSRFDAKVAAYTWDHARAQGGVGPGTLVAVAKQYGWSGTEPVTKRRQPDEWDRERERRRESDQGGRAKNAAIVAANTVTRARFEPHPYLEKKGMAEKGGLVLDADTAENLLRPNARERVLNGAQLIVPMWNVRTNAIVGVQAISADGDKRYLPWGCAAEEAVAKVGVRSSRIVCYCEGYATALAIKDAFRVVGHEALVICTFSAGNMAKVARPWRNRQCLVVADADDAGRKAASATGLPTWEPPVEGQDANDHYIEHGARSLGTELLNVIYGRA